MEKCIHICEIIFLVFLISNVQIIAKHTCEFSIDNCLYEVQVSSSGRCHVNDAKNMFARSKRAMCENSGNVSKITDTVEKLKKKMTREMKHLSTRVLRGVRRLDLAVTDLVAKQTKCGLRNPTVCPPNFVSLDNWRSCYMFSNFNATWYEARDYCNALDSEMASLTTLKEHYIVSFLIKNKPELSKADAWWTSGQFVSKTKTWMWTADADLRPFTFVRWAIGEPNESSLQCVMMFSGDNYWWHDQLCTEKFNFVCEYEPVEL